MIFLFDNISHVFFAMYIT